MSIIKVEASENDTNFTITGIDEFGLNCLYNALLSANLPEKRYLVDLTKEIKQFLR